MCDTDPPVLTELIFMILLCLPKFTVYKFLLICLLKHFWHCLCSTEGEMEALFTEFLWIGSCYLKRKRHILWQVCKEEKKNLPVSGSPVFSSESHWKTVRKDSYITSTTNDMRIFKLLLKLIPRRIVHAEDIFKFSKKSQSVTFVSFSQFLFNLSCLCWVQCSYRWDFSVFFVPPS